VVGGNMFMLWSPDLVPTTDLVSNFIGWA